MNAPVDPFEQRIHHGGTMIRALVFPVLLLAATLAIAEDGLRRFEVTPFVGYRVGGTFEDDATDAKLELDESSSYGLMLNMRADANTEYELTYSHQSTEIDISDIVPGAPAMDIDIDYLQLGGTYLWDGDLARPFLVLTAGLARLSPDQGDLSSETYFAFSIGGGWKIRPTRRLGLRLEGRFYGSLLDSNSSVFCRSGPQGSGCLIQTSGEVLWQWEMSLGASYRF